MERSASRCHWTCCRRVASCLGSWWRRTFLAHAIIKIRHVTFSKTVTASHVCRYSVNHSNVHLITALMAQSDTCVSQGSASTYFRWSGHFMFIFVKGLFLDIPIFNFHWNQFMFDRTRANDKLAPFFEIQRSYSIWKWRTRGMDSFGSNYWNITTSW